MNLGSMGALTINRRLAEDYRSFIREFPYLNPADSCYTQPISKKPKTTLLMHPSEDHSPVSSESIVSRLSRYPAPVNRIRREVHAPCRALRFGFRASSSRGPGEENSGEEMGSFYSRMTRIIRYQKTRKDFLESLQRGRNVNNEASFVHDVEDDSSIEEVEVVENGWRLQNQSPVLVGKREDQNSLQSSRRKGNKKVEDTFGSLRLFQDQGVELSVHKKLHQSAERRTPRLGKLKFGIEQTQGHLASLRRLVKKPEKEDILEAAVREAFKPLSEKEEADVDQAFQASKSNRKKILASHEESNIEITGEVMRCLLPGGWLNDEVINLYFTLLKERENREPKKFLKCHFSNTFFYKKLVGGPSGYDFKPIRRWTSERKLGYLLYDCDKIFVPIHKGNHWTLAVINKKDMKFQYLDSLGGADNKVLKNLAKYYVDEVQDKNGIEIDVSSWKQERVSDLPSQENGYDCGVFMIKYADFYSRGLGLCFNQEHMPYFRRRLVKEILRTRAE